MKPSAFTTRPLFKMNACPVRHDRCLPFFLIILAALSCSWLGCARNVSGKPPQVSHEPLQPKSGESVRITADFKDASAPKEVVLQYQIVDPGKYIALNDRAFKTEWVSAKMNSTGGTQFSAELPSDVQKHRRLVRYRLWSPSDKRVIAPDEKDPQPNFAYFVYDGVPAWRGAINPRSSDPQQRSAVTFSSEQLQRVPVYHFITRRASAENVTWFEQTGFGGAERHEYKYTGTMVYDGIVYDHVKFRARGGAWRHAMGKNMWKFNFLPGHRLRAKDDYGRPYQTKWDKLNLGACIQQGDYGMRGEQGMFEAVGFRLFNLAGVEAPKTHWIHFRIIDQAEESPASQYSGDFWGLYLATENIDGQFLKEHDLPPGNVYKIEGWQGKTEFNGDPAVANRSDVSQFLRATMRGRDLPPTWWQTNLNLPGYYNYRSILECIHHYDVDSGKNYFYYLNPKSHRWSVIPWDIDLTWGDRMFGGGQEPFIQLTVRPPFKEAYQQRLAEIRDLLFNDEQIRVLIDEHAAMISDPKGAPSLVDADRAKWDFHPIMISSHAQPWKAGQGRFYFGNPRNNFGTMVQYMKQYASQRMKWIDRRLLADYRPPASPTLAAAGPATAGALKFQTEPKAPGNLRLRLAEITDTNSPASHQPRKYEIDALWEKEFKPGEALEIPNNAVTAGHVYRVRARAQNTAGQWSRWSSPVQFNASK